MTDRDHLLHLVRAALRPLTAYRVPPSPPTVKLDANESPWPLPDEARERIGAALSGLNMHRYPDARATELRAHLSHRLGGNPESLLLGCGSDEVIALLLTALSEPRGGRERASILFPGPTFAMYRISAIAHGVEPVEVPLDESFDLDVDAMRSALGRERPNLVFLATPNNPTGNAFSERGITTLIEADPEALFVIDEAYAAFSGHSLVGLCDKYPNVALMGTLSKVGFAAARVGWCRLPGALGVEVDKARQPFNLNALSQTVAALALGQLSPLMDQHVERIVAERDRMGEELARFTELSVLPSAANFLLIGVDGDPRKLAASLLSSGIAIKTFSPEDPRLASHIRITIGTPTENEALLRALPEALRQARM